MDILNAYNQRRAKEDAAADSLFDRLIADGAADLLEQLRPHRRNAIRILESDMPCTVGCSKRGGIPDLPPEIPYPVMSGYTHTKNQPFRVIHPDGKVEIRHQAGDSEHIPRKAMQLCAQINLAETAPFDREHRLPESGMLWIFWSGDLSTAAESNRYITNTPDGNGLTEQYAVYYYDGDLSALRPTPPPCAVDPDYQKLFAEKKLSFSAHYEYDREAEYIAEEYEPADGDTSKSDAYYEAVENRIYDTRMLGFPSGANAPELADNQICILQFRVDVGIICALYILANAEAIRRGDFRCSIDFDLD